MRRFAPIPLDESWTCRLVPPADPGASEVVALRDWRARTALAGWLLRCERVFDLAPLDTCVGYRLHVRHRAARADVYLRGERVADAGLAHEGVDVTDLVSLEDNRLRLDLTLGAGVGDGALAEVWLEVVPCDA